MQEREGREAGLPLTYRLIDAEALGLGGRATCRSCWPGPSGSGSTGSTSPIRSSRPWCRSSTSCPRTPRTSARSTPWCFRDGRRARPQHRLVRLRAVPSGEVLPDAVERPGGAGRRRWGRRRGRLRAAATRAPSTSPSSTPTRARRRVRRTPGQAVRRRPGLRRHRPRARARRRPGRRQRDARRHERAPRHVGARRAGARRTCGSPTSSTSRSRPSWSRLARARGCRVLPGGGMAVQPGGRRVRATSPVGPPTPTRMARHFAELTA